MSNFNLPPPVEVGGLDLLIIGAGVYGIQAARTYLTIHPTQKVLILEADLALGGVWSKNRTYPHFFTQSPLGMWEYSDAPLQVSEDEKHEMYHLHFSAKHFTTYLEDYAAGHVFAGKSIRDRICFGVKVEKLWLESGLWTASTNSGKAYCASKVIDATGLTSVPNLPCIEGSGSFKGMQIHSRDFGRHAASILHPRARIVVIGGGKSAGDVAYTCAKSGVKEVHWVVRKSGNGPAAYLPADAPFQYANSNSAFHTSFVATFITNVYSPESWWTWFLYRTPIGQALMKLFWRGLQYHVLRRARYNRPDGRENGFSNLKPDGDLHWQFASSGVDQRSDFFDTIAAKVQVYRSDIDCITPSGILLQDYGRVDSDTIVYATGWKASTPFFDPQSAYDLGLQTEIWAQTGNEKETKKWAALETEADREVLRRFPYLCSAPPHYSKPLNETSFHLYRSMFPPAIASPSIAFLGKTQLANHTYNSEIQALYATAVFDRHLKLPEREVMESDIALVNAWMKRRYPTTGQAGYFLLFHLIPYSDKLLRDLGMSWVEKKRGLLGNLKSSDLTSLLDEYLKTQRNRRCKEE